MDGAPQLVRRIAALAVRMKNFWPCHFSSTAAAGADSTRLTKQANPIHRIIPKRGPRRRNHTLTCSRASPRYPHCQIGCVWFTPNVTIASVRLAWVPPQLPAAHHVASPILVPAAGSSARNVAGGRKLARHDSYGSVCDLGKSSAHSRASGNPAGSPPPRGRAEFPYSVRVL